MNYENNGLFNQRILDTIAVVGFMIGLANYDENISQSDVQEIIKRALSDIHSHLKEQDEKIDYIIELLKGGNTSV